MSRLRRQIAFWWTFGATLVLVAILGSPFVGNRLSAHHNLLLIRLIAGLRFMGWTYRPKSSMMGSIMVWLSPMIATILLAALIAAVASLAVSARGRFTALLAGWGLAMVAAPLISLARVAAIIPITHPGGALAATLSSAVTAGLWFGLVAGWTTGLVLACTVRGLGGMEEDDDLDDDEEPFGRPGIRTPKDPNWENTESIPPVTAKVPAGARQPVGAAARPAGAGARPAGAGARPAGAAPTVAQPAPGKPTPGQQAKRAAAKATAAQPAQKWPPVTPGSGS